jgi:hypothetical protein
MNPTEQKAQSFTAGPYPLQVYLSDDPKVNPHLIITNQGNHFAMTYDPSAARLIAAAPELLEACKIALDGNSALDKLAEKALRDAVRKAAR